MRKMRIGYYEAFNFVKKRRSVICPNKGFQKQLKFFEGELKSGKINLANYSFPKYLVRISSKVL